MTNKPTSLNSMVPAWVLRAAPRPWLHALLGLAVLLLDLVTGPRLLFPILFVIPVMLSAWYSSRRAALALAIILPFGRFLIAVFVDMPGPLIDPIINALVRVAVLALLAFLVERTSRQTKELRERLAGFVTMCAWSRTVEFKGEWLSVEQYMKRRFGLDTSHSISPAEAEKMLSGHTAQK